MDPRPHAVLVAEDEPPLVRLMKRVLERAGYEVMVAGDGVSALEAFTIHRERIDIAATLSKPLELITEAPDFEQRR